MARRRYRTKNTDDPLAGLLILIGIYAAASFQKNPLLVSISCAGVFVLLLFLGLWMKQKRAIRKANKAASDNLYHNFTPIEFEHAVAELFRLRGFKTAVTSASGDKGIDIILRKNDMKFGVQCKQYKESVGPAPIREFVGALEGRRLDAGYFVTTGYYTRSAYEAAANSRYRIKLINGDELGNWQLKSKDRLMKKKSSYTAFLPFSWWVGFSNLEKGIILSLIALSSALVSGALVYFLGTYFLSS